MSHTAMEETRTALVVINEMQAAGIIEQYAIGGAIAATFYIEPTATFDIDVFIPFENAPKNQLVSLKKLCDYLLPLGYKAQGGHFLIGGWQVQFLPADDELYREALIQAVQKDAGGVKTWIMQAEYLMAIALRTGRGKDLIRLEQFVHHAAYKPLEFNQILERHKLVDKWQQFQKKYIEVEK